MTVDESLKEACLILVKSSLNAQNCALALDLSSEDINPIHTRPSAAQVWGVGLLFVTLISCCAAVGIGLMPLLNRRLYHRCLTYFVGLGVGSLSGSAVFHLLPQAFGLVGKDNDHSYLGKAWVIVAGIYLFFFVDKFLKILMDYRKYHDGAVRKFLRRRRESVKPVRLTVTQVPDEEDLDLLSSVIPHRDRKKKNNADSKNIESDESPRLEDTKITSDGDGTVVILNGNGLTADGLTKDNASSSSCSAIVENQTHAMCAHDHNFEYDAGKHTVIGTVAWMIIFGDGLHNFIDGLSIGAAFSNSMLTGISISVAVLCEEFPHELGDVAILINAGMTLRQALTYNLMSAATCYLGFVLGVLLGELAHAQTYIFALAGGMFLYISLASMVPEMNNVMEVQMEKSMSRGLKVFFLQSLGVLTGLMLMYFMSLYGGYITFE